MPTALNVESWPVWGIRWRAGVIGVVPAAARNEFADSDSHALIAGAAGDALCDSAALMAVAYSHRLKSAS